MFLFRALLFAILFAGQGTRAFALTVSGRVVDDNGDPIAGQALTVEQQGGELPLIHTQTDVDGRYSVSDALLFGNIQVRPVPGLYLFAPADRSAFTDVSLTGQDFRGTRVDGRAFRIFHPLNGKRLFSPAAFPFPPHLTGVVSTSLITLRNEGTAPLTGLTAAFSGPHAEEFGLAEPLPASVPTGDSVGIRIRAAPAASGLRTAVMSLAADGANNTPFVINLSVSGLSGNASFVRNAMVNHALAIAGATATQSSTSAAFGGEAGRAIDGNTDGYFANGSVTHTEDTLVSQPAWWQVQLAGVQKIDRIVLVNRRDCCWDRLSRFRVSVLRGGTEVFRREFFKTSGSVQNALPVTIPGGISGDVVRISREAGSILSLAEVQVLEFTGLPEIAAGKRAEQSSTAFNGPADRAVDGHDSGIYGPNNTPPTITSTDGSTSSPWWEVDLGGRFEIHEIVLHNRTDPCCARRLGNFRVSIVNSQTEVFKQDCFPGLPGSNNAAGPAFVLRNDLTGAPLGKGTKVRIELKDGRNNSGSSVLSLAEVRVFGVPAVSAFSTQSYSAGDGPDLKPWMSMTDCIDLGGTAGEKVNGVVFSGGGAAGAASWSLTGVNAAAASNTAPHITGPAAGLMSDFLSAPPGGAQTLTLRRLIPGETYTTVIYQTRHSGTRPQLVLVSDGGSVRFDPEAQEGSSLNYTFTARSPEISFTFQPHPAGGAAIHQYAFANKEENREALLTDGFHSVNTGLAGNAADINFNREGRQGGLRHNLEWKPQDANARLAVPSGPDRGNFLQLASSSAMLDYSFEGLETQGGLMVRFDLAPRLREDAAVTGTGFSFGHDVSLGGGIGFFFVSNGDLQVYDDSTATQPPGTTWGPASSAVNELHRVEIHITDPDDANPFDAGGRTRVNLYVNGEHRIQYERAGNFPDNYLRFASSGTIGVDNLVISRMAVVDAGPFTVRHPGNAGAGSLRHTIGTALAKFAHGFRFIEFGDLYESYNISLDREILIVSSGYTYPVLGRGAGRLAASIDGGNRTRLFRVQTGFLELHYMKLTRGLAGAEGGGALLMGPTSLQAWDCVFTDNHAPEGSGGAVRTDSHATFFYGRISGNTARDDGGAVYCGGAGNQIFAAVTHISGNSAGRDGGALFSSRLLAARSLFLSNTAGRDGGAAVCEGGEIFVSTLTQNTAAARGGALFLNGPAELTHCTVVANSAGTSGGGLFLTGGSGSLLRNSILWNNRAFVGTAQDLLIASGGIEFAGTNIAGSIASIEGVFTGPAPITTDPLLSPPGDYGGNTITLLPLSGSPARDAALLSGTAHYDQRLLVNSGPPDIGAAEAGHGAENYNSWIWETLPPGTPADRHEANVDIDKDGLDNYSEWLALTDPGNAGSRFTSQVSLSGTNMLRIEFPSVSGRRYSLRGSPTMEPGSWIPERDLPFVTGDGSVQSFTRPVDTSRRFYMVVPSLPEPP